MIAALIKAPTPSPHLQPERHAVITRLAAPYRRDRVNAAVLMFVTAGFGVTFVSMQAFEWTKLILEGVRPWGNPMGAAQFGSTFFMITGFHGLHVTVGVIYLIVVAVRLLRGKYERSGNYQIVEIAGLYWHFVDLVWVFTT